jgi:hypothetical protein
MEGLWGYKPRYSVQGSQLVAGAKYGRATTTLVESQRVKTPLVVAWISPS